MKVYCTGRFERNKFGSLCPTQPISHFASHPWQGEAQLQDNKAHTSVVTQIKMNSFLSLSHKVLSLISRMAEQWRWMVPSPANLQRRTTNQWRLLTSHELLPVFTPNIMIRCLNAAFAHQNVWWIVNRISNAMVGYVVFFRREDF